MKLDNLLCKQLKSKKCTNNTANTKCVKTIKAHWTDLYCFIIQQNNNPLLDNQTLVMILF